MTTTPRSSFRAVTRAAALLATVAGCHASPVLLDFSEATSEPGSADSNGNRWTTIGTPGITNNLIDATGAATAINIDVAFSRFSAGFGGDAIDGPSGPAPLDQDFAVVDGIFSSRTIGVATVTLSGLNPDAPYLLSMIGGRATVGVNGTISVTIGTGSGGLLLNDGTVLDLTVVSDPSGVIAFTFIDFDDDNTNGATLNAMSLTEVSDSGLPLTITAATAPASGFILEWASEEGKLYNIRTSTDLTGEIAGWELVEGGIAGTAPMNQLTVTPGSSKRFYAVEEFDPPPVSPAP